MIHSANLKSTRHVVLTFALLFYLISGNSLLAQEQVGRPLIMNYSYQDYDAAPINWWALEDEQGIMYFANQFGVLQFDGVNWNRIASTGGARCMVQDEKGTIFIGRNEDIGYLEKQSNGSSFFRSVDFW